MAWVHGFLSSYNVFNPEVGDVTTGTDLKGMMAWMDNYCAENPLNDISDATRELIQRKFPEETTWDVSYLMDVEWLALFVAAFAISISGWSTYQSQKGTQAQLITPFLQEYSQPEMADAVRKLAQLRKDFNHESREAWIEVETEADAKQAWELYKSGGYEDDGSDSARRKLHWYYLRAYDLHKKGFLKTKSMQIIVRPTGYGLLFDVVWPITKMRHFAEIGENEELFEWYRDLRKNFPPREYD